MGWLGNHTLSNSTAAVNFGAFQRRLQEHGYVEGRNLVIERRFSEDSTPVFLRWPPSCFALKADVLVTIRGAPSVAAKETTATTLIGMAYASDPVQRGMVISLARPGGNITGIEDLQSVVNVKRL